MVVSVEPNWPPDFEWGWFSVWAASYLGRWLEVSGWVDGVDWKDGGLTVFVRLQLLCP